MLNSGDGGPWNGLATLAETYSQFTPTDERRGMWLAGQAISFETGLPAKDRAGNNLVLTTDIPDADKANEANGVRFNKFNPIPNPPHGGNQPNDYTIFRLAEMYLIKAEALNELGQTAAAIVELARIHNLHDPANPISGALTQAGVRSAIIKERLLELAAEGKRRTDLIRYGQFLNQWSTAMLNGKKDKTAETYRILFPIPAPQIAANPNLKQNSGY
jgi:hypothetical protein